MTEEVRRSVTVAAPPERAFEVFTAKFAAWWPPTHHIGAAALADAVVEPFAGGRWFERGVDGSECDWGVVLAYEPPTRLVLSWHIDGDWSHDPDPARASEVEVTFTEVAGGTRVDLVHRGFERHAASAARVRDGVAGEGGWTGILAGYAAVV
ncbi:SRPBCC family protein [Actinosynnema sp. NPDC053489]|uniref:SRPBCC family protein n=1 Tax=Actinosynnema sp. NPDC053489 TaxID=3363916 RepID=UPI0037C7D265